MVVEKLLVEYMLNNNSVNACRKHVWFCSGLYMETLESWKQDMPVMIRDLFVMKYALVKKKCKCGQVLFYIL